MSVSFDDFGTILVPLARRFGRSIGCDCDGPSNASWDIGCGPNYWPCLSMRKDWPDAVLRVDETNNPQWIYDLATADAIVATGRVQ